MSAPNGRWATWIGLAVMLLAQFAAVVIYAGRVEARVDATNTRLNAHIDAADRLHAQMVGREGYIEFQQRILESLSQIRADLAEIKRRQR